MKRISEIPVGIKQKFSNFDKAQYRQDLTLEIANVLSLAAIGEENAEAEAEADLLEESAKDENLFVAENLDFSDNETGKLKFFDAYGSLNVISSRYDPAYLKASSARARKRIGLSLKRVKPQSGENLRFVVLTQPDLFGFDFAGGYALLRRAIVRLKNHPFFKKNFRGGVCSDEFTLGAENTHFHFHSNILGYTKWLDFDELRRVWTDCLKKSARDAGRELRVNTRDGLVDVKIKAVTRKVTNGDRQTTLEDAITETVKYVVKGNDFSKIPTEFLCQVGETLRGKRLVETFGEANLRKGKTKDADESQYLDNNRTIQDSLSPNRAGTPDSANQDDEIENKSLRLIGAKMIREGRREEWKAYLSKIFTARREFRKIKLAQRYKFAIFCTLAGEVWRGVCVPDSRYYEFLSAVRENLSFA